MTLPKPQGEGFGLPSKPCTDKGPQPCSPIASRPLPEGRREPTHEQHIRELLKLPPEWRWNMMERAGKHPDYYGVTVEGGVCPPKLTGKNKGRPNWAKATMVRRFTVAHDQHDAWLAQWESDEGRCYRCEGTGEEFDGWSAETGTRYRKCRRCTGTGLPAADQPGSAASGAAQVSPPIREEQ